MIQKIYKGTDLLFSINIEDNEGNILKVGDVAELTMSFYTDSTNIENYIIINKDDIINNNQIFLDNTKLDLLNEGLLKYKAEIRFNYTSVGDFDIAKTVETEYFIKNDNFNDSTCTGGTVSDTYSKSEIDLKLSLKANSSDVYSKAETNERLAEKANKSDLTNYYTKIEVDEKIADAGTIDLSDYYKKAEVDNKLSTKVDMIAGKMLSTNDYTNADKTKLQSLNNYDDTSIKQSLSDKQDKLVSSVNIKTINNQSLLGTGNITISGGGEPVDLSNYYDKDEVNALLTDKANLSDISSLATKAELSTKADISAIAELATKTELAAKANVADVYTKSQTYSKSEVNDLIDNIETSGTTVDLTNYYKKNEVNALLANKADTSAIADMATKTELATKANISDVYSKNQTYNKAEIDEKIASAGGTGGTETSIETYILRWDETQATEEHAQLYTKLLNMFYYDESINVFFNALDGTAEYIINIGNIYKDNSATRNEIKMYGNCIIQSTIFNIEVVLKKDGSFVYTNNKISINNLADLSAIENRVTSLESEIKNPTEMKVDCLNYE